MSKIGHNIPTQYCIVVSVVNVWNVVGNQSLRAMVDGCGLGSWYTMLISSQKDETAVYQRRSYHRAQQA